MFCGIYTALLLKSGTISYWINPSLPSNKFRYHQTWTIGIKILRKKCGFNVAVISLNRAPFVGALKFITNYSYLIPSSKDVIPKELMRQSMNKLLDDAFTRIAKSAGEEELPLNIIILRSGGGDGLLKNIFSKEVVGIKQALQNFKNDELVRNASHGKITTFEVGVIFTVIQCNVPDVFCIDHGNGNYDELMAPVIVANGITSSQYLDAFISIPREQERGQYYSHIMRLVTIFDEYNDGGSSFINIRGDSELLSDYYQLIYSLLWGYAYHIPFPKKPNDPAPIKYATHFAEWEFELILEVDKEAEDLVIDVMTPKPQMIRLDTDQDMNNQEMKYDDNNDNSNNFVVDKKTKDFNRNDKQDLSDDSMKDNQVKDQEKKPKMEREIVDLIDSD